MPNFNVNCLILGDIHLGKGLNIGKPGIANQFNSRIIDQIKLLNWTLIQAIDHQVEHIILTGDIFEDSKPDFQLVNLFIQWVKDVEHNQINLHVILGNHDLRRTGTTVYSVLETLNFLESDCFHFYKDIETIYLDNLAITLLPFKDRKGLNQESNKIALEVLKNQIDYEILSIPSNYKKVLIGHLVLEGSLWVGDEIDDEANELICPLSFFQNYDWVWMGHIHRPQVLSQIPYLTHIGSMDLSDFGETDHQKKIIIFNSNSFFEIINPTRPLQDLKFVLPSDQNPNQYLLNQLQLLKLNNAIVRITITSPLNLTEKLDRKQLEKDLYQQNIYYLYSLIEHKETPKLLSAMQSIDHTSSPKEAIKIRVKQLDYLSEEQKSQFIQTAMQDLQEINK